MKKINLKIACDNDVIVIDASMLSATKDCPYSKMFQDVVVKGSNKYKIPSGKLTMRQKKLRTSDISKKILSKHALIEANTRSLVHEDLAIDILNLLDSIKKLEMAFDNL